MKITPKDHYAMNTSAIEIEIIKAIWNIELKTILCIALTAIL